MTTLRVALMWHGDRKAQQEADLSTSRFASLADALRRVGLLPEAVVYNDDFVEEVQEQLLSMDAVQVWVNPIVEGHNRTTLDQCLREVAKGGVLVSAHPDTILRMGTKQVLWDTREMGWGSDVLVYQSIAELADSLLQQLKDGPRVLKQLRGQNGEGVWKVDHAESEGNVRVRHAKRDSVEEQMHFHEFLEQMAPYFVDGGTIINQPYQHRLVEGMTRIYLVADRVAGFGHQAINALFPAPAGEMSSNAPQPGPRLYYPTEEPRFQHLRSLMEGQWIGELKKCLNLNVRDLPLLWDADLLLGPKNDIGEDTYVLCEINVSCVSPYPESADQPFAETLLMRLREREA